MVIKISKKPIVHVQRQNVNSIVSVHKPKGALVFKPIHLSRAIEQDEGLRSNLR